MQHLLGIFIGIVTRNKRYLTDGFTWIGIGQLTGVLTALATSFVFANFLDATTYGNYQFILTVLAFISIFTLKGTHKQIIYAWVNKNEDILISKTIQYIKYSVPAILFGCSIGLYFAYRGNYSFFVSIIAISLSLPLLKGLLTYSTVYLARKNIQKYSITSSIQTVIPALLIIPIAYINSSLVVLTTTYIIAYGTTGVLLYVYTVKSEKILSSSTDNNFSVDLHLSLGQVILDVAKIADRIIVFSFLGAVSFATYILAVLPVRELMRINTTLNTLLLPKMAEYSYEQVRRKILEKALILFLFNSILAGIYIALAPYLFELMFPKYLAAVPYSQLLVLLLPISSTKIIYQTLIMFDKTRVIYIANLITAIISISSLCIAGFFWGIYGIIIARLLTGISRLCLMSYYVLQSNK